MLKPQHNDVMILGAGAAGLMCAIEAGKRGRSVVVLEHNDTAGKKIRISGGGRCNFTNIHTAPGQFLSTNPHFAKSALARFTPDDFCRLVKKHGISFHEKKLGQLFCDINAQEIIDLLKKECAAVDAQILTSTSIKSVTKNAVHFRLKTNHGDFSCESLVVATGGLSIPPLGATDLGYRLAKQFAIKVNPCRPGLVPLLWRKNELAIFQDLSGLSVNARVSLNKILFDENILFTHKGLSGPAILQISSYWREGEAITIDILPGIDILAKLKANYKSKTTLKNTLADYLPARLAEKLCQYFFADQPLNEITFNKMGKISDWLHGWRVTPAGTEGYAKAEVTVGGVDTTELSSKTMETNKVAGLYFIGEVVDVTGHLGGYNFQWAWASGFVTGQSV
ncbi:MAG: NAD(P)/FAD-dependent oxidoreductase [Candidatus Omnitrophota bacterium]|nr:NAD(P)/FAD-dependent oxidoreductase [Candidatus Omnitrophota bacterium]